MRNHLGLLVVLAALPAAAQTCIFSLNPASAQFTASGGNDTVAITLVSGPSSCSRTATSNSNWISISFGTPGTGNGTVGYTVQSNPFTVERTGTLAIAGLTFTVTQAAGSCTYSLSPQSATTAAAGGAGSFTLTTNPASCPWTVASDASWLTVTSAASGTGTATVRYAVAANPTSASRTGAISAGSATFTVTQPGACSFTLNPASVTVATAGATGSVAVQAAADSCAWTAASNNGDWISLTGTTSGSGNGTVAYTVAANTTLVDRSGSITAGGVGFNVFQPASSCAFTLSSTTGNFPASGGPGSFYVTSACPWTPATSTPDWIVITSGAVTGSGPVSFVVAGNTSIETRSGSITVGSAAYAIKQSGVACSVNLAASAGSVASSGGVGNITVVAPDGCAWAASTTASWVTLANAASSGNGEVVFTAAANNTAAARTAIITVADKKYALTQDASQCDFTLSPAQATIPAAGGSGSFTVGTSCSWSAVSSVNWITASGSGGTVNFVVAANTSSDSRTGLIRVGTRSFTVVQTGRNCAFTVSPDELTLPGRGGKATAQVTGDKGCKWEPSKDQDWLAIDSWSSINGTGSVTVSAAANPSPSPRYATLSAGGQAIGVAQGGLEVVLPSTAGVLNAASFAAGPVAPGEILTIFGLSIGPLTPVETELAPDGRHITGTLGGVQVWFDGVPAPLIYVSEKQVSLQVPYSVTGKQVTELKVINQGVESNPLTLQVAATAPAIFTMDSSGKGQGAVLNQDNTVNGVANPAARNSIIQIFATGEGQTRPAGEDGRIASGTGLPVPVLPVTATVGGQTAAVVYAGAAPGAVAGLFQVNVRVPATAPVGGAVPVIVRVGTAGSQAGATVAVR